MRLDLDVITNQLKCKPWRRTSNTTMSSPDQILDHLLPPILPRIVKEDFLEFFTHKISGKLGWLRKCTDPSFTKFKVKFEPGGYRGLADFINWDGQLDGQFLEKLLPLLQSIAQFTINPLTVEQFWMLATELCKFTNFPLTSLDIRIIKSLSQMPTITNPGLARLLGVSYKKLRSRWNRLQRLNICRILAKVNYRLLGLIPVIVEIHDFKKTIRSPYLIGLTQLSGDSKSVLYSIVIPEEHLGSFSKFLASRLGTTHALYQAKDMGQAIEFTHYQRDKSNWNIDWRKLFIGAHLLHDNSEDSTSLCWEDRKEPGNRYFLDDKDKRIIPILMSDARIKLEKLADTAGMSVSQVSRRKSRLIDLGVLQLEPLIRGVGLIEDIIIRIKEKDSRIIGIFDELPQAWKRQLTEYSTGKREILLFATLPAGSFALMRYYLHKYLCTTSEISITGPGNGGWPLSFDTFDTDRGSWIWQNPIIAECPKFTTFNVRAKQNRTKPHQPARGGPYY
jgi:DNA-binding Lrp family transcriptional regulator